MDSADRPDWRDAGAYRFAWLDRPGFAWEWLRRDPAYRAAYAAAQDAGAGAMSPMGYACAARWGLVAYADPALPVPLARPLWRADHDAAVLLAEATPCDPADPDAVSLERLGGLATLVTTGDGEHLLLSDGWRRVRIDLRAGSLCSGSVCLHWQLKGIRAAAPGILALQRLLSVLGTRRFANRLWPPDPRARRWTLALRAHDALAQGARQRDLAALLAAGDPGSGWRISNPTLRLQAQRLGTLSRALAGTGFADRYLRRP